MRTPWYATRAGRGLSAFLVAFLVVAMVGATVLHTSARFRAFYVPAPWVHIPGPRWWLAFVGNDSRRDLHLLWDRWEPLATNARRADIVLLGNSRMQFAFPPAVVERFQARYGVRVVNLSTAAGRHEVALELLERLEARPAIIVVDSDEFFADGVPPAFARVRAEGVWGGIALGFEEVVQARVAPLLTRIFPRVLGGGVRHGYVLRSAETGAWLPVDWRHKDLPVSNEAPRRLRNRRRRAVSRVVNDLRAHGAHVVLTCVPARLTRCDPAEIERLATMLLIPSIMPPQRGLAIGDFSHLCPRSAKRFARVFFRELAARPEFRELRRQRTARSTGVAPP